MEFRISAEKNAYFKVAGDFVENNVKNQNFT